MGSTKSTADRSVAADTQGPAHAESTSVLDSLPRELWGIASAMGSRGNAYVQELLGRGEADTKCIEHPESLSAVQQTSSGTATIYTPAGGGNGQTLYFFFGYTSSSKDTTMRDQEDEHLTDDMLAAVQQGFTVSYDTKGTKQAFLNAVYSSATTGIYWSGHGYMDGSIQTSDGNQLGPSDIDKSKVGGACRYLILAACGTGVGAQGWREVMGSQCEFQGWVKTTTTTETNDFNNDTWFDSWESHNGTNPDKELRDYIDEAGAAAGGE